MCVKMVMKLISGILSLAMAILGLCFLIVGCILQFGVTTVVVNYIKVYTDELNRLLKDTGAQFDVNQYIGYLPQLTGNLAVPFIVMGVVIAAIGIVGLIGVCCENKCLLVIYIVILGVLIGGQVALVIAYYAARNSFVSRAQQFMQTTIDTKYTGFNNTNMETVLWNVFHLSLNCCGITNGKDFSSAAVWPRSVTYGGYSVNPVAYPLTCCNPKNYTACLASNHSDSDYSNHNVGCWSKIDNVVQVNLAYAALGTAAVILLQVLILVFAIHLCRGDAKSEKV